MTEITEKILVGYDNSSEAKFFLTAKSRKEFMRFCYRYFEIK